MENLEETIKEIKSMEEKDILWKACCDILRALTIRGGSVWHTDLMGTLAEMWSARGIGASEASLLESKTVEALKLLNEKGIVTSEKRMKAVFPGPSPIKETLHFVKEYIVLVKTFGSDREVLSMK